MFQGSCLSECPCILAGVGRVRTKRLLLAAVMAVAVVVILTASGDDNLFVSLAVYAVDSVFGGSNVPNEYCENPHLKVCTTLLHLFTETQCKLNRLEGGCLLN